MFAEAEDPNPSHSARVNGDPCACSSAAPSFFVPELYRSSVSQRSQRGVSRGKFERDRRRRGEGGPGANGQQQCCCCREPDKERRQPSIGCRCCRIQRPGACKEAQCRCGRHGQLPGEHRERRGGAGARAAARGEEAPARQARMQRVSTAEGKFIVLRQGDRGVSIVVTVPTGQFVASKTC